MSNPFEIHDNRFHDYALPVAALERLASGCLWTEGPVYFPLTDTVVWSDIPNDRMMQYAPGLGARVFRHPANHSNGNTRDREGRLVTCEHGARRVTRTGHDGAVTVLADTFEGGRLNSPNDVVVASDGAVWFTDPPYGILTDYEGHKAPMEQDGCHVYRIDPGGGAVERVIDDMNRPNGLAFSADEGTLYVSDTAYAHDPAAPRHIRAYRVVDGRRCEKPRVFKEMTDGLSDGFRLDIDGNIWTSAGDGVHCYDPAGVLLGKIKVPEVVSNLCFGGPRGNRLYITATTSLYAVFVGVKGLK